MMLRQGYRHEDGQDEESNFYTEYEMVGPLRWISRNTRAADEKVTHDAGQSDA